MQRFTQLYFELDQTTRTSDKLAALVRYFATAPPADAAWGLFFISGRLLPRGVSMPQVREWIAEETGFPMWLVDEAHDEVGDLAEAMALLLHPTSQGTAEPLHRLIETRLMPLRGLPLEARRTLLVQTWRELDTRQRLVWNKLMLGSFRVGVARTLVVRALASVAGVSPAVMEHRLMGQWQPTAEDYQRLLLPQQDAVDLARPYPFYLAYQLEEPLGTLGPVEDWQIEWKWDGIRAQLVRRAGRVLLWSRGEELITDRFPEIAEIGRVLPDGTVLDGEILPWRDDRPLPFAWLQRRIGRKEVTARLRELVPVSFMVFDLLETASEDIRIRPLFERRARLEALFQALRATEALPLRLSPVVPLARWEEINQVQARAPEEGAEGLMLKRRSSTYGVGRRRGDWWKWKLDPYHIDAVLMYAQRGHGRRASLYTDYTFGVWHEGQLVPIAKAYSGLTDEEIREVDAFIRKNTVDRFGPVRVVRPELVFELAFQRVQESTRHKAGVAVRFPRMARWRRDKPAAEADTLDTLRALIPSAERGRIAGRTLAEAREKPGHKTSGKTGKSGGLQGDLFGAFDDQN